MTTTVLSPALARTQLTAPSSDMRGDLWITRLFADSRLAAATTAVLTSPAAAYQDAIYDRGVLVDLRTSYTRAHQGKFAPDLGVVVIEPTASSGHADLVSLAGTAPLVLVTSDGSHALRLSEHMHSLGLPEVSALRGGFGAWMASGFPVA